MSIELTQPVRTAVWDNVQKTDPERFPDGGAVGLGEAEATHAAPTSAG